MCVWGGTEKRGEKRDHPCHSGLTVHRPTKQQHHPVDQYPLLQQALDAFRKNSWIPTETRHSARFCPNCHLDTLPIPCCPSFGTEGCWLRKSRAGMCVSVSRSEREVRERVRARETQRESERERLEREQSSFLPTTSLPIRSCPPGNRCVFLLECPRMPPP